MPLSGRQKTALDMIRDTQADRGYPITRVELMMALNLSSPQAVTGLLNTLTIDGHIRVTERGIELTENNNA